jgi:hypothetical protein
MKVDLVSSRSKLVTLYKKIEWCVTFHCWFLGNYLCPIIGDSICKDSSVSVKRSTSNCTIHIIICFQSLLAVFIPYTNGTIGPGCRECTIRRMEANIIDRIDTLARIIPVAFERKVFSMSCYVNPVFMSFKKKKRLTIVLEDLYIVCPLDLQ